MPVFSQILLGSLGLSLIHAAIPSHWLPLVTISQVEQWSRYETLGITALIGLTHTLSTILIGILIGLLGYRLASDYELIARIVAPSILLTLGLLYLFLASWGIHYHPPNSHHQNHLFYQSGVMPAKRSKQAIFISLGTAMFFSPCIELTAYYFAAGTIGWIGIAAVSLVYSFVTILGMILLVDLGYKSLEKLRVKLHFLERYEAMLTGAILVASGVSSFFIRL